MVRRALLQWWSDLARGVRPGASVERPRARLPTSVLVVGAGAAGLLCAAWLRQLGVECRILEAGSAVGGRMKVLRGFADFPLSLGAEWLTVDEGIFEEIGQASATTVEVETVGYDPGTRYGVWDGEGLRLSRLGRHGDRVLRRASWLDLFERHVLPAVASRLVLDAPVAAIDWSAPEVVVRIRDGRRFAAERVIVTVPLAVLQAGDLTFSPALPPERLDALRRVRVWGGLKAFFRCSEAFYPTFLEFDPAPGRAGEKMFYDAAYGHGTADQVLGFFAVGAPAEPYADLSAERLRHRLLAELDEIFDGRASALCRDFTAQNWTREPTARGAYVGDRESWRRVRDLSAPVGDQVFFAGDAYTPGDDWGAVHTAVRSAAAAVDLLLAASARGPSQT